MNDATQIAKTEIERLALRGEGEWWNAYYEKTGVRPTSGAPRTAPERERVSVAYQDGLSSS